MNAVSRAAKPSVQGQADTTTSPDRQRRRFRTIRWLGAACVTAGVGIGGFLAAGHRDAGQTTARTEPSRHVNVVVTPARMVEFVRRLAVQGNLQAKRLAMVSPRMAGVIDEIFVDEGDRVEAGRTNLFQTDAVKLHKTVEVRTREVEVAQSTLREKEASLEKNQADFDKAEFDWKRYRRLLEDGATADEEVEEAHAEYRRCGAMVKHANALIDLAAAQLDQAKSALAMARKDLDDSLVAAPIGGLIARRFQEPGEMGKPGAPVLRIEDPSLLEVSVFLPAQAYGEVAPGETGMQVLVEGLDLGQHKVTYKSPTIDPVLRTFEARCLLADPPGGVAPGAMAQVCVVLDRHSSLGVPRDAVQRREHGTVVFVAEAGMARMVEIRLGLETDGMCEVVSGTLRAGDPVVATGGYFLDEGTPVEATGSDH